MIHNTTEGLAIVAPLSRDRSKLWHLVMLGSIAGVPTIGGTWIGGFSYSPELSTLFLALGAGAIFQVLYQLARLMLREKETIKGASHLIAGFMAGLIIMYLTGIAVVT